MSEGGTLANAKRGPLLITIVETGSRRRRARREGAWFPPDDNYAWCEEGLGVLQRRRGGV